MKAKNDIQSYDAVLDAKYGAPGTDQRAKAEEDALAYYSGVLLKNTSSIKTEIQYKSIMKRIDELFFATDENTPANDPRLVELDALSAQVEEYEKEECVPLINPEAPLDSDILAMAGTFPEPTKQELEEDPRLAATYGEDVFDGQI